MDLASFCSLLFILNKTDAIRSYKMGENYGKS